MWTAILSSHHPFKFDKLVKLLIIRVQVADGKKQKKIKVADGKRQRKKVADGKKQKKKKVADGKREKKDRRSNCKLESKQPTQTPFSSPHPLA